jgi:hypothetical protein
MITATKSSCMFFLVAACVIACLFSSAPAAAQAKGNQQVNLSSDFNIAGIFSNGTTFLDTGDIDGGNVDGCANGKYCSDAYSAQALFGTTFNSSGPVFTPPSLGIPFNFGPVNTVDCGPDTSPVVNCVPDMIKIPTSSVTITLSPAQQQEYYSTMIWLGNAIDGAQPVTVVVNYTTGSATTFTQTVSDWCSFGDNAYESIAVGPINGMRINSDGTPGSCAGSVYAYTYPLDYTRYVESIMFTGGPYSGSGVAFVSAIDMKPPSYSLTSTAATPASIPAGGTSTATVTVTPQPGYSGTVTLTCTVLPTIQAVPGVPFNGTPPTCVANPTTVTLTGEPAPFPTTALTFTTVAPSKAMAQRPRTVFYAFWLSIPGLALVGFGLGSGSRRKKRLGMLLLGMVLAGLIATPACVSTVHLGNVGTPPGVYNLTMSGIDTVGLTQAGSPVAVSVTVTQ